MLKIRRDDAQPSHHALRWNVYVVRAYYKNLALSIVFYTTFKLWESSAPEIFLIVITFCETYEKKRGKEITAKTEALNAKSP